MCVCGRGVCVVGVCVGVWVGVGGGVLECVCLYNQNVSHIPSIQ